MITQQFDKALPGDEQSGPVEVGWRCDDLLVQSMGGPLGQVWVAYVLRLGPGEELLIHSMWVPHFQKRALARSLVAIGIDYVFLSRALGGRPDGEEQLGPSDAEP